MVVSVVGGQQKSPPAWAAGGLLMVRQLDHGCPGKQPPARHLLNRYRPANPLNCRSLPLFFARRRSCFTEGIILHIG